MIRFFNLVLILILQSTFAYAGKLSVRLVDGTNLPPMRIVGTSLTTNANGNTLLVISAEVAPNTNKYASINVTGYSLTEVASFIAAVGGAGDIFVGNLKKGVPFAGRDMYEGAKGTVNMNLTRPVGN